MTGILAEKTQMEAQKTDKSSDNRPSGREHAKGSTTSRRKEQ